MVFVRSVFGVPNILGSKLFFNWTVNRGNGNYPSGALFGSGEMAKTTAFSSEQSADTHYPNLGFDASKSSSVYVNSATLRPNCLTVLALLKL